MGGTNFNQIPVNCPYRSRAMNYQRDGPQTVTMNQEGAPNYFPNSFSGPRDGKQFLESKFTVTPDVGRFNSADEDNFTQCGIFFRDVLNKDEKFRLVDNIASHVINAQEFCRREPSNNLDVLTPNMEECYVNVLDITRA